MFFGEGWEIFEKRETKKEEEVDLSSVGIRAPGELCQAQRCF